MTDENEDDVAVVIASNLDAIIKMSPDEQEKFAKAELDVLLQQILEMDPSKQVDFLYDLMSDRLNRVYIFGYQNGYADGYKSAAGDLN